MAAKSLTFYNKLVIIERFVTFLGGLLYELLELLNVRLCIAINE